eukprot:scaffold271741_cov17-Tisochrysis_lutea.AAC.1
MSKLDNPEAHCDVHSLPRASSKVGGLNRIPVGTPRLDAEFHGAIERVFDAQLLRVALRGDAQGRRRSAS